MFKFAIEEMAVRGIISPKERREFLEDYQTWLLETIEH